MTEAQCGICKRWSESRPDGAWAGAGNRCPCCGQYVVASEMPHREVETTGTADTQLLRAARTEPPPIVTPALGVTAAEDRHVPVESSPPGRISMGPETVEALFAQMHRINTVLDGAEARDNDNRVRDTQIAVLSLQEQMAAVCSGVTAVLHFIAPLDNERPLNGKRVLLVEDESTLAPAYVRMLEGWGAKVETRATYLEASHWIDDAPHFDVAVLDVKLPGGSGLDIAARIADEWPTVALVLTTGFPAEQFRLPAARIGAEVLNKPHNPNILLAAILKQIGRLQG